MGYRWWRPHPRSLWAHNGRWLAVLYWSLVVANVAMLVGVLGDTSGWPGWFTCALSVVFFAVFAFVRWWPMPRLPGDRRGH